ncbi:MAG TPA: YraN family protein [Acetobacteraceae bacterium]|nr:YraN family protein [Acetobacteraceae bacterium]
MATRRQLGGAAYGRGIDAEAAACAALEADGWTVLGRRLRTKAGEVDAVAEKAGLLAIVEVKARPTLGEAAEAVSVRQRARLIAAAGCLLADHPGWGAAGVRFDVLVVDAAGVVRRIADAFRDEG